MIVGIGYKRRSGKDTVADRLVQTLGLEKMAFATALKDAAAAVFGFTPAQLYGDLKDVTDPYWGFSPGWALQALGTEGGRRVFGDDLWIRVLQRRLRKLPPYLPGVVIADVRFVNEAEFILAQGGVVIRVDRPVQEVAFAQTAGQRSGAHTSETSLDSFTRWSDVIVNDGTLVELYQRADACVRRLGLA